MQLLVSKEHIEVSAGVRSGKPRIAGTKVAVEDVVEMYLKLGYSLIEIAGTYNLDLGAVYAAMAYYFDHRKEMDHQITENQTGPETLKNTFIRC